MKKKKSFSESFEVNPAYALEWKLKRVIKAQAVFEIWNPVKVIIETENTIEDAINELEGYLHRTAQRLMEDASGSNQSSSRSTNLARAWKAEQGFDCVKVSYLTSGLNSLPGLIKYIKKELVNGKD